LRTLRKIAGRIEAFAFDLRGGAPDRARVEEIGGASVFVPAGVMSPKMFRTGIVLAEAVLKARPRSLLDMGSGSGIVGVLAAKNGSAVTAVDVDPLAVRATRVSAMLSKVSIDAREGDLFSALDAEARFDLCAFNPPFFARRVDGPLSHALSGGEDLDVLDRFLSGCREHLQPEGIVLVAGSTVGALEMMRTLYEKHGYAWRTVRRRERISERLVVDELRG
jgi:release factor glutamine methyltransferase